LKVLVISKRNVTYLYDNTIIMLAMSRINCNVWHQSLCHISILTMTHQVAACDMVSVHFSLTIMRTYVLVLSEILSIVGISVLAFVIHSPTPLILTLWCAGWPLDRNTWKCLGTW